MGNGHGRHGRAGLPALGENLCLELSTVNAAIGGIGIHRCPPNLGGHHRQQIIGSMQGGTARRSRRGQPQHAHHQPAAQQRLASVVERAHHRRRHHGPAVARLSHYCVEGRIALQGQAASLTASQACHPSIASATPCPPQRPCVAVRRRHRGQGCREPVRGCSIRLRRRVDNPAGLFPSSSRTAFQIDGGQLAYHPARHSGTPPKVSAIAWNAVRDQPGMSARDQLDAQSTSARSSRWPRPHEG